MSLFSSILGAISSQSAAKAQKRAADAANATVKEQYQQTRGDLSPFMQSGNAANTQQSNLIGLNGQGAQNQAFAMYQQDPSYQWQRQQAIDATQGSAAARGSLFSGSTLRGISDRTQNIANLDYSNYWNRLGGLADRGQNAATALGSFGANAAQQRAGYIQDHGNANANSIMAPYNAYRRFVDDASKAAGAFSGGAFG